MAEVESIFEMEKRPLQNVEKLVSDQVQIELVKAVSWHVNTVCLEPN